MERIEVSKVTAAPDDKITVHPVGGDKSLYEYVYRAAVGVSWDSESSCFTAKTGNDGNILECVKRIIMAVYQELGVLLHLTAETNYLNMPRSIQSELLAQI